MSVDLRLALQEERAADLAERVRRLLGPFSGNEVALDAGTGTGSVAFALAPLVAEVVGVDTRADYLDAGRPNAPENVATPKRSRMRWSSSGGRGAAPTRRRVVLASGAPEPGISGRSGSEASRNASVPSNETMVAPLRFISGQKFDTEKRR